MTLLAQTITLDELKGKIARGESVQIVNVLSPEQYDLGVIKDSIKIPLAQLDARADELDREKDVVTYCAGRACSASRAASEKLAAKGFRARAYEGGIEEWKQAGLPLEAEAEGGEPESVDRPSGLSGMPTEWEARR